MLLKSFESKPLLVDYANLLSLDLQGDFEKLFANFKLVVWPNFGHSEIQYHNSALSACNEFVWRSSKTQPFQLKLKLILSNLFNFHSKEFGTLTLHSV